MIKSKKTFAHLKLYCFIFGHRYRVSKEVTLHVKEYTCNCCKRELTTNSNGNLIELTPTFQEINDILEDVYARRQMRLSANSFVTSSYLGTAVGY